MTCSTARNGFIAILVALVIGCSPDEPIINSYVDEWRLVSVNDNKELTSFVVPNGETSKANPNNVDFGSSPSMIRFRDNIYIFSQDRPWIVVYDAEKLVYTDTIFTMQQLDGIADLCFANATTAYATSPANKCIGVIDLTASKVASLITTQGAPRQIACLGNQICATIPDSNVAIIIDSRSNTIVDKISVGEKPWFVRDDPSANVFCIVSLGAGKVDASQQTTPTVSFLSPTTREILKSLDVTIKVSDGPKQFPRGLAITSTQYAYIPVQSGLLRVSTKTRSRVSSVQTDSFDIVSYNDARAELICQRAAGGSMPQVVVFDENGSTKKFTVTLPYRATSLLGIPR